MKHEQLQRESYCDLENIADTSRENGCFRLLPGIHSRHDVWAQSTLAKIEPLIPNFAGSVAPMKYNRFPDARLTMIASYLPHGFRSRHLSL